MEGIVEESARQRERDKYKGKTSRELRISTTLATYTWRNDRNFRKEKKNSFYKYSSEELSERGSSNHQCLFSQYSHKTGYEE